MLETAPMMKAIVNTRLDVLEYGNMVDLQWHKEKSNAEMVNCSKRWQPMDGPTGVDFAAGARRIMPLKFAGCPNWDSPG